MIHDVCLERIPSKKNCNIQHNIVFVSGSYVVLCLSLDVFTYYFDLRFPTLLPFDLRFPTLLPHHPLKSLLHSLPLPTFN